MSDDANSERLRMVASGELTLAELEGLTAAEAYAIADFGWMLLEQGRHQAAAVVFETLTLGNPNHAYFHALFGAALQRGGDHEAALDAYGKALSADPDETAALVNKAELLLLRGLPQDADEAATLLSRALALDESSKRPETERARALAEALAERIQAAG